MSDPLLHEGSIMDTLDCQCISENTSRLQAGALLSLIDAYDRRLERDKFIKLAETALNLHTSTGKLYMLTSVEQNYKLGALDADMITTAMVGASGRVTDYHAALYRLMEQVCACPTSHDRVH